MSHNETCILSGPGGGWEVDGYTQDPSMGSASSFTYGCNSLYLIQHQNYTDIFSWMLYYKNSKFQVRWAFSCIRVTGSWACLKTEDRVQEKLIHAPPTPCS